MTLTGNPNFETKSSYSFDVMATDAAGNIRPTQAVSLAINNLDEVAPTITSARRRRRSTRTAAPARWSTRRRRPTPATIGRRRVTYSLGGADAAPSASTPSTGEVTLTGNPNFETKSSYSFTWWRPSGGQLRPTQAVTLAINNLDEVAPIITSGATAAAIDENSGAGQVVYTRDGDRRAAHQRRVTYSLGGADAAAFSIDGSTGEVTLTANPNYEAKSSYSFT